MFGLGAFGSGTKSFDGDISLNLTGRMPLAKPVAYDDLALAK